MDLLGGYGSGSDDEESDTPLVAAAPDKQQPVAAKSQQQQRTPAAAGPSPPPPTSKAGAQQAKIQLPSPDMLFGGDASGGAGSKRTFTSVTGHSLPASTSHSKASKEHSASKPGSGGKQQAAGGQKGSMLVPPQLRGRSNVVTEDLDKLFSKKTSPAAARKPES